MPTYNQAQIDKAWSEYRKAKAWRVLRGGEWYLQFTNPDLSMATRAEMVDVRAYMGFPKWLERQNGRKRQKTSENEI